jgi:hypothetical protein
MTIDLSTMTPEMKAALTQQLIADTFSSKTVHAIGDNLAKGLIKLASATQKTTDATARWAGTAEVMAVPTAIKAAANAKSIVIELSSRVAVGITAGCKAATAPKDSFSGFSF